eukprot:Cvel_22986.t1-p1 / transcript=Cvel_22986.t1 / gene=Cvel_22986 / organism=Chromera_velia_CCMP2878 / gene_product=DEAD-box ATP-dependent RNA helicase ISE2,, putative / transcript_product=DEAD-box ATP-dependent RNA helicase ISE2,, putative / location=Cvel_scaffold2318:14581-30482(+) / protein_length=1151 / sequence_SO=supercontig / SO=protein_coding / is_pseudo=false
MVSFSFTLRPTSRVKQMKRLSGRLYGPSVSDSLTDVVGVSSLSHRAAFPFFPGAATSRLANGHITLLWLAEGGDAEIGEEKEGEKQPEGEQQESDEGDEGDAENENEETALFDLPPPPPPPTSPFLVPSEMDERNPLAAGLLPDFEDASSRPSVEAIRQIGARPEVVDLIYNAFTSTNDREYHKEVLAALYPFELDDFQQESLDALLKDENVIVAAPTGSGKTVVGELAMWRALAMGKRVIYTSPLKALSNQKFADFCRLFGEDRVGLLTGDTAIRPEAPVTVMTTEVYRNILYSPAEERLSNSQTVIFDEFHYINDPWRGSVWEESVINCPSEIQMVGLSATMANPQDLKDWLEEVHGKTRLILSEHRPVPLRYHLSMAQGLVPLFEDPDAGPGGASWLESLEKSVRNLEKQQQEGEKKKGTEGEVTEAEPLFESSARQVRRALRAEVGPGSQKSEESKTVEAIQQAKKAMKVPALNPKFLDIRRAVIKRLLKHNKGGRYPVSRYGKLDTLTLIRMLRDDADFAEALGVRETGGRLTRRQVEEISEKIDMDRVVLREIPSYDRVITQLSKAESLPAIFFVFSRAGCDQLSEKLGDNVNLLSATERAEVMKRLKAFAARNPGLMIESWRVQTMKRGISSHHAGLLPIIKVFIEELFNAGLIRVLFATETLAAGVNMPCRTAVLTKMDKYSDAGRVRLSASELLQMAGRAGRRGKDSSGTVVMVRSEDVDEKTAGKLLLQPVKEIRSQFSIGYGFVANVLRDRDPDTSRVLIEKSFAVFMQRRKTAAGKKMMMEPTDARRRAGEILEDVTRRGVSLNDLQSYIALIHQQQADRHWLEVRAQMQEQNQAIAFAAALPDARIGSGVCLRTGEKGALLGPVDFSTLKEEEEPRPRLRKVYAVLLPGGRVEGFTGRQVTSLDPRDAAGLDSELAQKAREILETRLQSEMAGDIPEVDARTGGTAYGEASAEEKLEDITAWIKTGRGRWRLHVPGPNTKSVSLSQSETEMSSDQRGSESESEGEGVEGKRTFRELTLADVLEEYASFMEDLKGPEADAEMERVKRGMEEREEAMKKSVVATHGDRDELTDLAREYAVMQELAKRGTRSANQRAREKLEQDFDVAFKQDPWEQFTRVARVLELWGGLKDWSPKPFGRL